MSAFEVVLNLDSGSASGSGGGTVLVHHTATPEGGHNLHGSVAQVDDEEQVEDGTEQSAHKVCGHAAVGLHSPPVVTVEGVCLALLPSKTTFIGCCSLALGLPTCKDNVVIYQTCQQKAN